MAHLGALSASRCVLPKQKVVSICPHHPSSSSFHFFAIKDSSWGPSQRSLILSPTIMPSASSTQQAQVSQEEASCSWPQVSAVLFDMDGVLCDSEERSRLAAVDLFAEMGVRVSKSDFDPFMGTGEANFLGGVAQVYEVKDFDVSTAKSRFFQIYLEKYATPNSGLGFPGSAELITQCRKAGLKIALASSADRLKIDANLADAGLPSSLFDAIISADAFENLKPAPDIFLAASKALNVSPKECIIVEDALSGLYAAKAAGMRCIAVTTTLSDEQIKEGNPILIRKDISHISLDDILQSPSVIVGSTEDDSTVMEVENSMLDVPFLPGFKTTRHSMLRYGSFAIALVASYVTISHLKGMSYASPKGLVNALTNLIQPTMAKEVRDSNHVAAFVSYIQDLESRGGGEQVEEFNPRLEWLNTIPLKLHKDLAGKVVVLDFWTYCCINCMHILPDLEYIENKYKDRPVAVIGVHSAKFDNEKDLSAIRNAVLRYNVMHPVVNDGDMIMWRQLGVNSWPTLALVSPQGKLLGMLSGEGHRKDLDDFIRAALLYYGEKNVLNYQPLPQLLERNKDTRLISSPLNFPGKLTTDLANGRLFISDSNHHRIVVTDLDGKFLQQIGGAGGEGLKDGRFDDAAFNRPQGVAYNPIKNTLYVADTENHALREINFVEEYVSTLAGNGTNGSDYTGGKSGTSQLLNSPWDVAYEATSGIVYIAMAGQHQIWQHTIADGVTKVFSGDGYECNLNGKRGQETSFAQPSGLSLSADSKQLYVADSESSSVRTVDLATGGSTLIAGGDPLFADNLFQFGDRDGTGTSARFQHPLGVLYGPSGLLYIADTYNHKIKIMDPNSRKVTSLAGTGQAGFKDGYGSASQLSEPAGLAQGQDGTLFIADTNNNIIRILDLMGDKPTLSTLDLKGVQPPQLKPDKVRRLRRRQSSDVEIIMAEPMNSATGNVEIQISLPDGFNFTKEATSKFEADVEPDNAISLDPLTGVLDENGKAIIKFTQSQNLRAVARINCKVYYCEHNEVCLYKNLMFQVPFNPSPEITGGNIQLAYSINPPKSKGIESQW